MSTTESEIRARRLTFKFQQTCWPWRDHAATVHVHPPHLSSHFDRSRADTGMWSHIFYGQEAFLSSN